METNFGNSGLPQAWIYCAASLSAHTRLFLAKDTGLPEEPEGRLAQVAEIEAGPLADLLAETARGQELDQLLAARVSGRGSSRDGGPAHTGVSRIDGRLFQSGRRKE